MRIGFTACACAALCFTAGRAGAVEISDRAFDLRIDPPRGALCMAYPAPLPDAPLCARADPTTYAANVRSNGAEPVAMAVGDVGSWKYVVVVVRSGDTTVDLDDARAAKFASSICATPPDDAEESNSPRVSAKPTSRLVRNVQVTRVECDYDFAPGSRGRMLLGSAVVDSVVTNQGQYVVIFGTAPEHIDELRALESAALETLRATPGRPAIESQDVSTLVGHWVFRLLVALAAGGVLWFVTRRKA